MSERSDDLRRQFGTVWRMASSGLGTLREVVVRSSQAGRLRVDLALLAREKQQQLAALGRQVAALLDEGALEVPEEVRQTYDRVRDVDARIQADSSRAHDNAFGAPRGYEPEAGNFMTEHEHEADPDEHAEVAEENARKKPRKTL
jgi:hypothetical protein